MADTITLWRPVGQRELELVAENEWTRFPPRLTGQPVVYPVLNEAYATKIARDWNTNDPANESTSASFRWTSARMVPS